MLAIHPLLVLHALASLSLLYMHSALTLTEQYSTLLYMSTRHDAG